MPPATMMSASPNIIACAASITALSPEPHTLLIVIHSTVSGNPANKAACRAGACPTPAVRMQPIITSSMSLFLSPARLIASSTTIAPRRVADNELRLPPKEPIGVLQPLAITTSRIFLPPLRLNELANEATETYSNSRRESSYFLSQQPIKKPRRSGAHLLNYSSILGIPYCPSFPAFSLTGSPWHRPE